MELCIAATISPKWSYLVLVPWRLTVRRLKDYTLVPYTYLHLVLSYTTLQILLANYTITVSHVILSRAYIPTTSLLLYTAYSCSRGEKV